MSPRGLLCLIPLSAVELQGASPEEPLNASHSSRGARRGASIAGRSLGVQSALSRRSQDRQADGALRLDRRSGSVLSRCSRVLHDARVSPITSLAQNSGAKAGAAWAFGHATEETGAIGQALAGKNERRESR